MLISPDLVRALPNIEQRQHLVGNLRVTIGNFGQFGRTESRCLLERVPGVEFPAGSGIHFFHGGLWVGAKTDSYTVVSTALCVGAPPYPIEFWAEPPPSGDMIERTVLPMLPREQGSLCSEVKQTDEAISEQDILAVYYDTLTD